MSNFYLDQIVTYGDNTPLKTFRDGLAKYTTDHRLPYSGKRNKLELDQVSDRTKTGQIYNKVVNFLNSLNVGQIDTTFFGAGQENFRLSSVSPDMVGGLHGSLAQLCRDCGVKEDHIASTMENLAVTLYRYTNNKTDDMFRTQSMADNSLRSFSTIYPNSITSAASYSGSKLGMEMFGPTANQKITDIKTAMTIVLIKGYKGLTNRVMHRVANDTGVVQFVRPNDEFYDLAKSMSKTTQERQSWAHRNQLITLHRHPEPVDMELIPVVPQKALDTDDLYLVEDNILLPNVEIPLWDLAVVENKIGYDQFNYTDLLSSKIGLRAIHLKVTQGDPSAGGVEETFMINLAPYSAMAMFSHLNNTIDNVADRGVMFSTRVAFDKDMLMSDGNRTTIFAAINRGVEYVLGTLNFNARANLQSARAYGSGSLEFRPVSSVVGVDVTKPLKDLIKDLKCEIIGWEIDAFYSEVNFRKTNMAVRSMSDVITYALPDGRTIVVDHAHNQALPEHVLDVASEVQTLGIDHRNLQIVMKTLKATYDRIKNELVDKRYIENYDNMTVAKSFVAGSRVNPTVMIKTIDFNNVVNFQSSDVLSDLWTYMRACLNTITSEMHYRSLLLQQLEDTAPVYKCITTTPVLDTLLSLANVHENQMPSGKQGEQVFEVKTPGKSPEFKTVLPNGTVIEFVTTAFHYMQDTMILIPYCPNQPDCDLNFGVNCDGGQYSVNWQPTDGQNATIRRSMQITREYPVITNGLGAIITISNRDKYWSGLNTI